MDRVEAQEVANRIKEFAKKFSGVWVSTKIEEKPKLKMITLEISVKVTK